MSPPKPIAAGSWTARHAGLLTGAGLVLATLVLFWPLIGAQFVVVDDDRYVYENPWVTGGLSPAAVRWAFTAFYAANWHPLTWISHMLDCSAFGLFPGGHHLTNVVLHSFNSLLLFLFLRRFIVELWPCALAAALFAWHPLHVESVAWISERKDVLSTFFFLLTLIFYACYAEKQRSRVEDSLSTLNSQPSTLNYCLALLFFALGLMAKPTLVTLPCILLLLDYWPLERLSKFRSRVPEPDGPPTPSARLNMAGLVWEKLPFFALSLAVGVLTPIAQHAGGAFRSLHEIPMMLRVLNVPVAYANYLFMTIWPAKLCVFYPMPADISVTAAGGLFLILAGLSFLAYRRRRTAPFLLVGWLWFLGALVPMIGLVQIGRQALADRYTYIASIGLFLAFALSLRWWIQKGRLQRVFGTIASLGILLGCAAVTRIQLRYWHDSIALFTHALSVTGSNAFSENNLGVALSNAGRGAEAIPHYLAALRLKPDDVKAHFNLGVELVDAGRRDQALAHFLEALKLDPTSEKLHNNAGVILAQQDHLDLAREHFEKAIKLNPSYPNSYLNLAIALQKQGEAGPAVTNYLLALQRQPDWPNALVRLAFLVSTCPESGWRNPAEGVRLAERASQLVGGDSPEFLDTMAVAYAAAGKFSNAVFSARLAARQAQARGLTQLTGTIELNLANYRAGKSAELDWRSPQDFEIQH